MYHLLIIWANALAALHTTGQSAQVWSSCQSSDAHMHKASSIYHQMQKGSLSESTALTGRVNTSWLFMTVLMQKGSLTEGTALTANLNTSWPFMTMLVKEPSSDAPVL